jgi:hypothetical protein
MKRKTPEGDAISVYDIVLTRGDENLFEVVGVFERILVLPEE